MFVVIAGTNRPGSNTLKLARLCARHTREAAGAEARLLDLQDLPPELFRPECYAAKPAAFAPWQEAILAAEGILSVVPEYNGSFPGALKYFLDMLRFPDSLVGKPAAFVGVAGGEWGSLRAVEQLEMVFQYRKAHLYGERVFIPRVHQALDERGELRDPETARRVELLARGFVGWSRRIGG
jgi:NAD(P)H-dependent FMN reductase